SLLVSNVDRKGRRGRIETDICLPGARRGSGHCSRRGGLPGWIRLLRYGGIDGGRVRQKLRRGMAGERKSTVQFQSRRWLGRGFRRLVSSAGDRRRFADQILLG